MEIAQRPRLKVDFVYACRRELGTGAMGPWGLGRVHVGSKIKR